LELTVKPRAVLALALLMLLPAPLSAQWRIGLELATEHYGGSSRDTGGVTVGPGAGTAFGIRIERSVRSASLALRLAYSHPGFAASGGDLMFVDKSTGLHFEAGVLTSFRVGGIGPSGAVRAELGPALQLWNVAGEVRARLGGVGAAVYEWPVAARWIGRIRLEGMLSESWFDRADVPDGARRRPTWRYGIGLGLSYRLT
jgi:hypothetical protein